MTSVLSRARQLPTPRRRPPAPAAARPPMPPPVLVALVALWTLSLVALFLVVYAVGFIGSIALLIWILNRLGYNFVNGLIFFVFFSAVSFLGFRLRQSAHELALIDERQGVIQTLADFLSTPFVRVGHWISDKYAKINLVTLVLDLAIEMPLKTSLRLLRQWISFMRDKQEEL